MINTKRTKLKTKRALQEERQRIYELIKALNIDTVSGIGFKNLKKAEPWTTTYRINFQLTKYNVRAKTVYTPFVYALRNENPGFFYSKIAWNANKKVPCIIVINNDADDHYKINGTKIDSTSEEFEAAFNTMKAFFPNAYTTRSTNGKGWHNLEGIALYRDDYKHKDGSPWSLKEVSMYVRGKILQYQAALRNYIERNSFKLHMDVLGIPAIYDDNGLMPTKDKDGIGGRGTWVKIPNNMMDDFEFQKLCNMNIMSIADLEERTRLLEVGMTAKQKTKKQKGGSFYTNPNFANIQPLTARFNLSFYNGARINIGSRHYMTAEKHAWYTEIQRTASEHQSKNASGEYENTLPTELTESIGKYLYQEGIMPFRYNSSEFSYVVKKNYEWGILVVPVNANPGEYKIGHFDEQGEYVKGIARKMAVTQDLIEAFLQREDHQALLPPQDLRPFRNQTQYSRLSYKLIDIEEAILAENYILYKRFGLCG
jgi:hypothetical protein